MNINSKKISDDSTTSIEYEGIVEVELRNKDKIISTKQFKNNGRWPLFYFLDVCLAGNYSQAEQLRPKFIQLFNAGAKGTKVPLITEVTPIKDITEDVNNKISMYPCLVQEININQTQGYIGESKIEYTFNIPILAINETAKTKPINLVCLYNTDNLNKLGEPSCYIFIEYNGLLDELLTIDRLLSLDKNYTLYIKWIMNFKNKGAE